MGLRRRVLRQELHLRGLFGLEDEPNAIGWRDCQVLDLSEVGVGITLHDLRSSELIGHTISAEVPSAHNDRHSLRTKGEIKNVLMLEPGVVRAGIEFDGSDKRRAQPSLCCRALNEVNDAGATVLHAPVSDAVWSPT